MSDIRSDIATFLKKHGPAKPREILDAIGGKDSAVKHALRTMLKAKEVIAAGTTQNRTYGLPGQPLDAPAPAKKPHRHAAKKRPARKPRARRHANGAKKVERPFLTALTASHEIVVFDGEAAPRVYTREASLALADLVFSHFSQE